MDREYWKGKKVLVTGHTGFKGSWLCIWLLSLGADVIGYALEPKHAEDNYVMTKLQDKIIDIHGDIRDRVHLQQVFEENCPEIVFHLAAQPLVLESYQNPYETYEINVMGTMNVLEAIRHTESVRTAIMITTDKCYENRETLEGYKETDPFGGCDPYSSSKACDEILIASYRNSYFPVESYEIHNKAVASVRAGNVIGGGDWAVDRILPDCMRAIEADTPIPIRNKHSIRPWQHVLEPLSGYLMLAEKITNNPQKYSGGWNFGPSQDCMWTVWDVAICVMEKYGKGKMLDQTQKKVVDEAAKLVLNIEKAESELGWTPRLDVETAIAWTVDWYRNRKDADVFQLCQDQIVEYQKR